MGDEEVSSSAENASLTSRHPSSLLTVAVTREDNDREYRYDMNSKIYKKKRKEMEMEM